MSITTSLGTWIPEVDGQYINMDWNPTNKGFGAQCWDLAAHWSAFLGLPIINTGGKGRWPGWAGNMVDGFPQSDAIAAAYTLHGPNEKGQPGDITVWGDSYWYYPATHVAVLYADRGGMLTCISQNSTASRGDNPYPEWSSGPATLQDLPRQGLIGFIRPNLGEASIGPAGEITIPKEDTLSAAEVQQINDHTTAMLQNITLDGKLGERNRGGLADLSDKFNEVYTWLRPGQNGVRVAGPIPALLASIQGQNAGLLEALKQVGGGNVDLEAITAAAEEGARSALSDLQATATTTVTLEGKEAA